MANLNPHLDKLSCGYFFQEIDRKAKALKEREPDAVLLDLGIGDITKPLAPHLLAALCTASQEMGDRKTFRGYGPSQGYPFLREAILYGGYHRLGISIDEIFVSNGAKCDLANIQEIFSPDCKIGICDPSYPVFIDSNVMAGRTHAWSEEKGCYEGILIVPSVEKNGFLPLPPSDPCDLIYLCSPNNPTGVAMTRPVLKLWVDYAIEHRCILLYDGAYEAFISSPECPHSIYEIEGAREVAIEVRSFSKSAGFTGLRCSYMIVPKNLRAQLNGKDVSIHSLWRRRQDTKFGGVPYPIQKCATAMYTEEGKAETQEVIGIYKERARFLLNGLKSLGFSVYGGQDAPYVWCKTPKGMHAIEFFDQLLEQAKIICIPGSGFGCLGDSFVRFSAFADAQILADGLLRIKQLVAHGNVHYCAAN